MTDKQIKKLELEQAPVVHQWEELEAELSALIADESS
jgi:hypothetical protein